MPRGDWKPVFTKLFDCLSIRDRSRRRPGSSTGDKTLSGRIQDRKAKKKARPIPSAFLDRFWSQYARADPLDIPVRPAVKGYYTQELTKGDYNFDARTADLPETFEGQLNVVKSHNLSVCESVTKISPDKQWRVVRELSEGSFGMVYLVEWYPFETMDPIRFALKDTTLDKFWADYCVMVGCPNVIKIHDWVKSYKPQRSSSSSEPERNPYRFRILYDYYDHGDLQDLLCYYEKHE